LRGVYSKEDSGIEPDALSVKVGEVRRSRGTDARTIIVIEFTF